MSGNLMTRTACGLYVMGDGEPRGWSNFSWTQPVVDLDGTAGDQENQDAIGLIGYEVMAQVGRNTATGAYAAPIDVAFACLHEGEVLRVERPDLDFADPEIPGETVVADWANDQRWWTVCGLLEDSWRTVCFQAEAGSPLVAYFRAWEWVGHEYGAYFLLAAVHEGQHPAVEGFGYADPLCRSETEMRAKAREKWGVG